MLFIGRWCPLHSGHTWIIEQKRSEQDKPVLVLVRDTGFDEFSAEDRAELVKCISQCFQSYPEIMGIFRMVLLADDTRERLDNRELRFCLRFQKLKVLFEQWTLKRFAIPATFMYKLKTAIKTGFYGTLGSTFAVRATEILSQLIRSDTNLNTPHTGAPAHLRSPNFASFILEPN